MNKSLKKVISCTLAVASFAACFASCKKTDDDADALVMDVIDLGYGTDWLYALGEKFTEKTGVEVKIYPTVEANTVTTQLTAGVSKSDLIFESFPHWERIFRPTTIGGTTYETLVADISDIYTAKIPDEDVTMEEKMYDRVTGNFNIDGKYYQFPWVSGATGIIYNKKVWRDDWQLPRTTNELVELCEQIKDNDNGVNVPFIYSLKNTYWYSIYATWATQYEGLEAMNAYLDGYDSEGNRYVPEMVLYDGFERCLDVMETLLKHENGYIHSGSKGYNFTDAQVKFLDGAAVMQPNGDWIQSEMSANFSPDEIDIRMMKTPIISSIVEKCTVVKTEEQLVQVIDYVDGVAGATLPVGLTDDHADVKKIKEARSIVYSNMDSVATIPIYSDKIDLAKQFLQFMASDEGIETYAIATGGYRLPFAFDYDKESIKNVRSTFLDSTWELSKNGQPFSFSEKNPIFQGGMSFLSTNMNSVETYLGAVNGLDRLTANEIFLKNYENVSAMWDVYMQNVKE